MTPARSRSSLGCEARVRELRLDHVAPRDERRDRQGVALQAEGARGPCKAVVVDHARQRERGRRPEIVVVVAAGAHRRCRADQSGEGVDRRQVSRRGDPDEALCVEVVAAEQALAVVARREQARLPVVQQVALVDGLHAGRAGLAAKRAPDLASAAGLGGQQRRGQRTALVGGRCGDGVERQVSHSAASLAQYVMTRSAPARRIAVSDSRMAVRRSSAPAAAAASSMAYSPETWYAARGRGQASRTRAITSRYGSAGLTMTASAPSAASSSASRTASRALAGSSW